MYMHICYIDNCWAQEIYHLVPAILPLNKVFIEAADGHMPSGKQPHHFYLVFRSLGPMCLNLMGARKETRIESCLP